VANSTLEARWAYAEELRFTTHMRSEAVLSAFSTVPRERFLGPGPLAHQESQLGSFGILDDSGRRPKARVS
jgi:hypothetical protein